MYLLFDPNKGFGLASDPDSKWSLLNRTLMFISNPVARLHEDLIGY